MEMKPLKLLMVLPNLRVSNGVSSFAMEYFRLLDKTKLSIDFLIFKDVATPYYKEIKNAGGKIFCAPAIKNVCRHFMFCKTLFQENSYDIIHVNTLLVSAPLMFCAAFKKVPVRLLHSHSSKLGETKFKEIRNKTLMPILRLLSTDFSACSDIAGRAMFGKQYFKVIPNLIEAKKFEYNTEKRNLVRKQTDAYEKTVILTVGRLSFAKNPFFALNVFAELIKRNSNIEYWWAGSGLLDNEVLEYVKKLGLQNTVKLLGSREDVADLYQAADVFFLPSQFEGLGIVLIEAQASGLRCITSNVVPEEVVCTDLVSRLSLEDSVNTWSQILEKACSENHNRLYYNKLIENSVFSNKTAGNNLFVYYTDLLKTK